RRAPNLLAIRSAAAWMSGRRVSSVTPAPCPAGPCVTRERCVWLPLGGHCGTQGALPRQLQGCRPDLALPTDAGGDAQARRNRQGQGGGARPARHGSLRVRVPRGDRSAQGEETARPGQGHQRRLGGAVRGVGHLAHTPLPGNGQSGRHRMIDIEAVLIAWLEDNVEDVRASNKTPSDLDDRLPWILVRRTGGPYDGFRIDRPTVDIETFAATSVAAADLALHIQHLLHDRLAGAV